MKSVYPIIITPPENGEKYYLVYIPGFDVNTEGKSLEDALFKARFRQQTGTKENVRSDCSSHFLLTNSRFCYRMKKTFRGSL